MLTVTTTGTAQGVVANTRGISMNVGTSKNAPHFNPLESGLVFLGG